MTFETEMNVSDEMLMALADGELTGPDASKLMARVAADPDLAARYALFTGTTAALRQAMDPGHVPDYLISTVLTAPVGDVVTTPAQATNVTRLHPKPKASPQHMVWPMALAASLALAMGVVGFLTGQSFAPAPLELETAAAALAGTETGGSVSLADGSAARALGSFDTELGLCRLIAVDRADGQAERAVVCKTEGVDWRTALAVTEGGAGVFLPASDIAVSLIDDFLTGIGAGASMTPEDEAQILVR